MSGDESRQAIVLLATARWMLTTVENDYFREIYIISRIIEHVFITIFFTAPLLNLHLRAGSGHLEFLNCHWMEFSDTTT